MRNAALCGEGFLSMAFGIAGAAGFVASLKTVWAGLADDIMG
jgi:hypothetical protein